MPFHFRKRFTIVPGVRLNLNKKGASLTLGPRGTSLNIGPKGGHLNASFRGTGLSYRTQLWGKSKKPRVAQNRAEGQRLSPIAPEEHRYDPPPAILQPPPKSQIAQFVEKTRADNPPAKPSRFGPFPIIYGTVTVLLLALTAAMTAGSLNPFWMSFLILWLPFTALTGVAWIVVRVARFVMRAMDH